MTQWKELTEADGQTINVNLQQVAYMRRSANSVTEIVFLGGGAATVRESPEEIHQTMSIFSGL
jgi:hypothetical protein